MSYEDQRILGALKLLATGHGASSRSGLLCPLCEGGRHKERSLSMTIRPDGAVLWICHRANCGKYGRFNINGGTFLVSPEERKSFKPRPYKGETRAIHSAEFEVLSGKYGLHPSDFKRAGGFIDIKDSRLGLPVFSPSGKRRGVELRLLHPEPKCPKTLHFRWEDEPWVGWMVNSEADTTPIVVVEDLLSAIKVSRQFTCVSLMGSHMGLEDIMEISNFGDNILLALDKDATGKALKFKQRFMYLAPKMQVILLQRDLKYETDEDIKRILS